MASRNTREAELLDRLKRNAASAIRKLADTGLIDLLDDRMEEAHALLAELDELRAWQTLTDPQQPIAISTCICTARIVAEHQKAVTKWKESTRVQEIRHQVECPFYPL